MCQFVLEMNRRSVGEDSELDDPNLYPIPNFNFRARAKAVSACAMHGACTPGRPAGPSTGTMYHAASRPGARRAITVT